MRGTEQFRIAEAEGKLLRLPTGDGGALVFRTSPEAPVLCALEIAKALKNSSRIPVRMGIHSGPVNEVTDLNEQANIAGAGINIAQRVTDCGDAGHILLSRHVAEDLEHYPRWRSDLHELGECEVKHGMRVSVVNSHHERQKNANEFRYQRAGAMGITALLLLLRSSPPLSLFKEIDYTCIERSDKSIAVLPFETSATIKPILADGIQDDRQLASMPT